MALRGDLDVADSSGAEGAQRVVLQGLAVLDHRLGHLQLVRCRQPLLGRLVAQSDSRAHLHNRLIG